MYKVTDEKVKKKILERFKSLPEQAFDAHLEKLFPKKVSEEQNLSRKFTKTITEGDGSKTKICYLGKVNPVTGQEEIYHDVYTDNVFPKDSQTSHCDSCKTTTTHVLHDDRDGKRWICLGCGSRKFV